VGIQLLLFVGYLLPFSIYTLLIFVVLRWIGLGISLFGLLILLLAILQLNKNLTPFPTPKTDAELVTFGLYRYVRHPIYSGILLMTFGFGIHQENLWRIIISFLLLILFYFKTAYEKMLLLRKFKNYDSYRNKTGRFFPRL
jgi:protein-S-isoprenylcysteine O-methyltransferase Ste14